MSSQQQICAPRLPDRGGASLHGWHPNHGVPLQASGGQIDRMAVFLLALIGKAAVVEPDAVGMELSKRLSAR